MKTLVASLVLICFTLTLFTTPQAFTAESALSDEQVAAIMKTPEIQAVLGASIDKQYQKETKAWFLELSNLARSEKTMQGFFDKLYGPESALTSDDRTYIKEVFKDAPPPAIITTKNGIKVSIQGQSVTFELGRELGSVLMNGKPAQDVDLSKGIRAAVEPSKNEAVLRHFRTSPSLALFNGIQQAHAVVPLVAAAAYALIRWAVVSAAYGALYGTAYTAVLGCLFPDQNVRTSHTILGDCANGIEEELKTSKIPAVMTTSMSGGITAMHLYSLWDGTPIRGMRDIRPDEVPKIQKFMKVGGILGILAAAYQAKSVAEGYGVKLECNSSGDRWSLYSMHAGKQGATIDSHGGASTDEIRKQYEKMLTEKGIPENARPALVKKALKEHNEHTEFCKKNPGKTDSAIFSDIKSATKTNPKSEGQGVRK